MVGVEIGRDVADDAQRDLVFGQVGDVERGGEVDVAVTHRMKLRAAIWCVRIIAFCDTSNAKLLIDGQARNVDTNRGIGRVDRHAHVELVRHRSAMEPYWRPIPVWRSK